MFGALIEFAIVVILDRSTRALENKKIGTTNSMKANYLNNNLKRQMQMMGMPMKYLNGPKPVHYSDPNDIPVRRYIFGVPRAYIVDVISFWAFLLLFSIFNGVYWMKYLNL